VHEPLKHIVTSVRAACDKMAASCVRPPPLASSVDETSSLYYGSMSGEASIS